MEKKKLYFAASLFNLGDKFFNVALTEVLKPYFDVLLPQERGFEFSKLHGALRGMGDDGEIEDITNRIIYFYDIGHLLASSDFCLARLDEPSDEGVISEIGHAMKMRIPIIGYRTDCRSPYGSFSNEVRGAHFFPAYDCHVFINFTSRSVPYLQFGKSDIGKLAELVYSASNDILRRNKGELPHKRTDNHVCSIANILFSDIGDVHSEAGLNELVRRYNECKKLDAPILRTRIINE